MEGGHVQPVQGPSLRNVLLVGGALLLSTHNAAAWVPRAVVRHPGTVMSAQAAQQWPGAAPKKSAGSMSRRDHLGLSGVLGAASAWLLSPRQRAAAASSVLCDDSISHLRDPGTGKEVYLIGTAHISNASALLVRAAIREVRPQTVMLELDESRVGRVKPAQAVASFRPTESTTVASTEGAVSALAEAASTVKASAAVPRDNKPNFLKNALTEVTKGSLKDRLVGFGAVVIGRVISGLYKSLDKMGFVSGQEFMVAIDEARAIGADLLLGDRDVKVTLRRLSEALSQSDLNKVMGSSPQSAILAQKGLQITDNNAEQLSKAVETLKQRETVQMLMAQLKQELPAVYRAMIEERDEYMANALKSSPSKLIVGVVGIGHLEGIERFLSSVGWQRVPCRRPAYAF